MHILFLLTQDLESPSGLGRYFPLAQGLVRLGHQVSVAALHASFGSLQHTCFERNGVKVWYVAQMHVRKHGSQKSYFPARQLFPLATRATWALTRAAFTIPADVIHLGKPHPMNGLAGVIAGRVLDKPLYLDCDDYEAASNRFAGGWQRRIVALFEDWLPRMAEGVTVNTRFLRDRLISLGVPERRIIYVPNGVDRQRCEGIGERQIEYLRKSWTLEGKRVVAYVGSMSLTNHPVDLLISAFSQVTQIVKDAVLLLVGGGEDLEKLREQVRRLEIEDVVRFIGRVAPDQAPAFLALADVSVDPVRDDDTARARCPLKVFESLAVGTPVVTGDVGDRGRHLHDGRAGVLVAPSEAAALAEGILAVLRDRDRARAMGQAALELRGRYYWDVLVHDFVRVYDIAGGRVRLEST